MTRIVCAAVTAVLVLAAPLLSGEQTAKKPLGTWSRTKDDATHRFTFAENGVHFLGESNFGKLELDADYAVTKDGHLYGRIRKVIEGAGPKAGELYGFKFKLKGDTLTISDWQGTGGAALGQFLQGEYKKVDTKQEKKSG